MPHLRFKPVHPQHSIEDFFLGIRFARQLSEQTFSRTVADARNLAQTHDLPAENQQASLLLALDPIAGVQPRHSAPMGTFFQRFNSAGAVQEELRMERNFIGYRTSIYTSWTRVIEKIEALVLPLANAYASEVPLLDSALIQYVDRFLADGQIEVDWSELFRSSTPWVVSGMIPTKTAWHSHCGRFEESPRSLRRLVNVNVDVGEPPVRPGLVGTHSIAIVILCTDQFTKPGSPPKVIDLATLASDLRANFDVLHDRAKAIVRELLADDYLARIGM